MTTALRDIENVKKASRFQVDGYLIKPVDKRRLIEEIRELDLMREAV
ncbi:MAG: hypothetical protein HY892_20085 [Deltaproteobacteria bacterium]|nr:hypothetical protein [Deltaproteobacteria bacterium]